jgi:large subunit ribosomal protein L13
MNGKKSLRKTYYLFNCQNFILGRMAVRIAQLLQGKNSFRYAPNKIGECFIIVTNSDKLNVSGRKKKEKKYHYFSGYPGGITSRTLEDVLKKDSRQAIWNSVYGMLPKNKLRDIMMKKIFIFKDENHNIQNAQIKEITSKSS